MKTTILPWTLVGLIAIPLTWLAVDGITAGPPPRREVSDWDNALSWNQPAQGRPRPERGEGEERRPPHGGERGFGGEGGESFGGPGRPGRGGPPPLRGEGPPPGGPRPHMPPGGASHLEHLRQVDPEMAEFVERDQALERKTHELAGAIQRAEGEQRDQIRESLAQVVNEHFEVRQNRRKLELKRLEAELERLLETIETRTAAREEIVKRRIAEVLGNDPLAF